MTQFTRRRCDICEFEEDGNQQEDHTDITDWGPIGSWIDPEEMTGPAEHLCSFCLENLKKAVEEVAKGRAH